MLIHLRAAGTSLVLDARGPRPPVVVHWGRCLGALGDDDLAALADAAVPAVPPSSIDEPLRFSLLPGPEQGWSGRPAITGWWSADGGRPGGFHLLGVVRDGPRAVRLDLAEAGGRLLLSTEMELSDQGVLRARQHLSHVGAESTFHLDSLSVVLPVPDLAKEVLDFSGLWAYERRPQRAPLRHGVWSRETRHGRPGHDDPYLMMAEQPGLRLPRRPGVGDAPGLERRQATLGRAAAAGLRADRRSASCSRPAR
nr:hypothetical protein GCM10020092_062020 [Actinoplanes digitatis]